MREIWTTVFDLTNCPLQIGQSIARIGGDGGSREESSQSVTSQKQQWPGERRKLKTVMIAPAKSAQHYVANYYICQFLDI